jgi:protein-S-isoprenylcysteine O-methyltransferase Ste14
MFAVLGLMAVWASFIMGFRYEPDAQFKNFLFDVAIYAAFIASFLAFIPFEERQLLRARGDAYRAYIGETPYRVFRGIW